jgi:NADPH:quinone reductase-like Zn-dependent oxidoreductase
MLGMTYGSASISSPVAALKTVPDKMLAVVIDAPGHVRTEEVATPRPGRNEVLVQIEGCGINPDDVIIWENSDHRDYPLAPGAPGREAWGWVAEVGEDVRRVKVGDRVAILSQRGFAEYDVVAQEDVARLPIQTLEMPFPSLVLAQAMNIFCRSRVEEGSTVAVVGAGILGTILVNLSASVGANVIALSRRQFALDIARELGATQTVLMNLKRSTIVDKVTKLTNGGLCDVVFEVMGRQDPLLVATELTKAEGQLILAGSHVGGLRQVNLELWSDRSLDIVNAHSRNQESLRAGLHLAVDEAGRGRLNPGPVCSHIYDLAELGEALNTTKQRPDGFLKAIVIV